MARFSDLDPITVNAYDGQYIIAKHPDGHCFISTGGTREAREQLEVLVRMAQKGWALRKVTI